MNANTNLPADEFAAEVTRFVDDFVGNATPEEIDRFLEEGEAAFYNTVVSPEMTTPSFAEASTIFFDGSFWSMIAWPGQKTSESFMDFKVGDWQAKVAFGPVCSDHPDLALAA